MKKLIIAYIALTLIAEANAQKRPFSAYDYTEASTLTMVGKIMPGTPNPYNLLDTCRFKGFTPLENQQVRLSTGLAVAFRTNSPTIVIYTDFILASVDLTDGTGTMGRGYCMYIKKNGQWIFAAAEKLSMHHLSDTMLLGSVMDDNVKECLLYFPLSSEERSIQIGTEKGSFIEPLPNPFRHRIAVHGSSFTRGTSSARPGMGYSEQFARHTGLQTVNLGCNGNARLQPYFADVLCAVEADAFLLDVFSNPTPEEMRERFFPFLDKIRRAHPGVPIIFQQTIRRERRNFDLEEDALEEAKMRTADSLMTIAVKRYEDVYYVRPEIDDPRHLSTVDGIHPDNYGYYLWAKSIEKPVLKILKKYGIR